jgi:hypothetical protein
LKELAKFTNSPKLTEEKVKLSKRELLRRNLLKSKIEYQEKEN